MGSRGRIGDRLQTRQSKMDVNPTWLYDGDDGWTVRFGDGERGAVPVDGTSFEVTYRVGGGPTATSPLAR